MLHCNIVSHWLGTYTKWSLLQPHFSGTNELILQWKFHMGVFLSQHHNICNVMLIIFHLYIFTFVLYPFFFYEHNIFCDQAYYLSFPDVFSSALPDLKPTRHSPLQLIGYGIGPFASTVVAKYHLSFFLLLCDILKVMFPFPSLGWQSKQETHSQTVHELIVQI